MFRSDKAQFLERVQIAARAEIAAENFKAAVEREKVRIREHRSFWSRVFPFIITIRRR